MDWFAQGSQEQVTVADTDYTNWNKGEPNDAGGREDCVFVYQYAASSSLSGKWNDAPCTFSVNYVCEISGK